MQTSAKVVKPFKFTLTNFLQALFPLFVRFQQGPEKLLVLFVIQSNLFCWVQDRGLTDHFGPDEFFGFPFSGDSATDRTYRPKHNEKSVRC